MSNTSTFVIMSKKVSYCSMCIPCTSHRIRLIFLINHGVGLKGTVLREFLTLFLKSNNFSLDMYRKDFEFFRIFEEILVLVIDSLVCSPPRSRDSPVYSPPWIRDSTVYSSPGSLHSPVMNKLVYKRSYWCKIHQ